MTDATANDNTTDVPPIELPPIDALTEPWWEATRDRRLLVQRCESCGHHQHYPRALCLECRGTDLGWVTAAGTATIHSFTVVHRAPSPSYVAPYVVALVRLAEGPTLLTQIVGVDATSDAPVVCDQPVVVDWLPLTDGRHLPVFTPREG